jgi:hypothetical protein
MHPRSVPVVFVDEGGVKRTGRLIKPGPPGKPGLLLVSSKPRIRFVQAAYSDHHEPGTFHFP